MSNSIVNFVSKTTLVLLMSMTGLLPAAVANKDCNGNLTTSPTHRLILEELPELLNHLISNNYGTGRNLEKYLQTFPELSDHLNRFGTNSHWLDLGSGQGLALADFLRQGFLGAVTGVTYSLPENKPNFTTSPEILELEQRSQFHVGRFFEDIPIPEVSKADVITDLFGVLSYSLRVDTVLNRVLQLLKPNGVYYFDYGDSVLIQISETKTVLLHEYLNSLPGITIIQGRSVRKNEWWRTYSLTVDQAEQSQIPKFEFELTESSTGAPSWRTFRLKSPETATP